MSQPPFQAGDFVWCAFPERENTARPASSQHLAYILAVSLAQRSGQLAALAAYTTSQTWHYGTALPLGVHAFNAEAAANVGQARPFVLDLRRLAFLPVAPAWFPRLEQAGRGIQGRAPKPMQRTLERSATELLARHADIVERLGPLWPSARQ